MKTGQLLLDKDPLGKLFSFVPADVKHGHLGVHLFCLKMSACTVYKNWSKDIDWFNILNLFIGHLSGRAIAGPVSSQCDIHSLCLTSSTLYQLTPLTCIHVKSHQKSAVGFLESVILLKMNGAEGGQNSNTSKTNKTNLHNSHV